MGRRWLPASVVEPDVVLARKTVHVVLVVVRVVLEPVVLVEALVVRPARRIVAQVFLAVPQTSCGRRNSAAVGAPVVLDGVVVALCTANQFLDVARLDAEVRLVRM